MKNNKVKRFLGNLSVENPTKDPKGNKNNKNNTTEAATGKKRFLKLEYQSGNLERSTLK